MHHRSPRLAGITVIGGEKFSGKPSDWPETKTEIIAWLEANGYSYISKTGTTLFHFAGSGDHDHLGDDDLQEHYVSKMWPTQLRSIRSQVTKSTLDVKCEEYQSLTDDEKAHQGKTCEDITPYGVITQFPKNGRLFTPKYRFITPSTFDHTEKNLFTPSIFKITPS